MSEIKIEKGHGIFYECPECGYNVELGAKLLSKLRRAVGVAGSVRFGRLRFPGRGRSYDSKGV